MTDLLSPPTSEVTLRPARFFGDENDLEFVYRVYAAARADEMAMVGDQWAPEQKEAFLRSQFELQHQHYQAQYPNASYHVICDNGRPIGRYYVDRGGSELRLMDIALLASERGRGIGGRLVRSLLEEADARGILVSLHVEATNPAKRLYERLGFRDVEEVGPYWLMHRKPGTLVRSG